MSESVDTLIQSAQRNGYSMATSDLYKILKARKGNGTLTWEELDLMTEMMKAEVERFMPKDSNSYDELPQTIKEMQG